MISWPSIVADRHELRDLAVVVRGLLELLPQTARTAVAPEDLEAVRGLQRGALGDGLAVDLLQGQVDSLAPELGCLAPAEDGLHADLRLLAAPRSRGSDLQLVAVDAQVDDLADLIALNGAGVDVEPLARGLATVSMLAVLLATGLTAGAQDGARPKSASRYPPKVVNGGEASRSDASRRAGPRMRRAQGGQDRSG